MVKQVVEQEVAQLTPAQALAEAKLALTVTKQAAKDAAQVLKDARLAEKAAKEAAKALGPVNVSFTRSQATGEAVRLHPSATVDELIEKADALYCLRTGKVSNPKEARWNVVIAKNFLLGYLNS